MKKIIIVISSLILIGVVYFLIKDSSIISEPTSTFTHSSGAFSFKYPSKIFVSEDKERQMVAIAESSESKNPMSAISVLYYPDYLSYISKGTKSADTEIKEVFLGNHKTLIVSHPKYPNYAVQYIIPLDNNDNPSSFIVGSLAPNTNGFSDKEFTSILETLSIDKEKMDKLIEENIAIMKKKSLEAKLKATLSSMRPSAELYYDLGKGYVDLCNPLANSQGEKLLKDQYKVIIDDIGFSNMSCLAKKDSYTISIKMPAGNIWCIDSTGFMGEIPSIPKGYSCK